MDAREQLRRYLEQRREMGERELVLDGMSVDEVHARRRRRRKRAAERGATSATRSDAASARDAIRAPRSAAREASRAPTRGDWRATRRATAGAQHWRATGAEPAASPARPVRNLSAPLTAVHDVPTPSGELFGGALAELDVARGDRRRASRRARSVRSTRRRRTPCRAKATRTRSSCASAKRLARRKTRRGGRSSARRDNCSQRFSRRSICRASRSTSATCSSIDRRETAIRRRKRLRRAVRTSIRQIELIRPKVILALGTFAAQTLLGHEDAPSVNCAAQVHQYHGVPLVVTYHPAALLRNPAWKRPTWEDVQLARRILDSPSAGA